MGRRSFVNLPSRLLALGLTLAATGCAPLSVFNALTPSDADGVLLGSDIPYGQGPRRHLDVYAPRERPSSAPVVVVFYGGSWDSGRKEDYAFLGKAIASRGFVTIVADYRLVPEVRFPAFLEDAAHAVQWAAKHAAEFGGDSKRMFLFGHSAGAYIAAMVALDGRYLSAAGASPAIIRGVGALAGPYDFLPLDVDSTVAAFGQAANLADTQPINFVSSSAPAMFLATGEEDTTVKPRNTKALAAKLAAAGRKPIVKSYPGVSHVGIMLAMSRTFRGSAPVLDDVTEFFKQAN